MHDVLKCNIVSAEHKPDAIVVIEEQFWMTSMNIAGFTGDIDLMSLKFNSGSFTIRRMRGIFLIIHGFGIFAFLSLLVHDPTFLVDGFPLEG